VIYARPATHVFNSHKNDGGRGPSKRPKDADDVMAISMQSSSPVQSASGFDDTGMVSSPIVPVPTQPDDAMDARDDASAIMEPWDAIGSPSPSLMGDDGVHNSPGPSDASQMSLPAVVFVRATPSAGSHSSNHASRHATPIQQSPTPPNITLDVHGDPEHSPEPGPSRSKEHISTTPAFAGDDCEVCYSCSSHSHTNHPISYGSTG
jgi:hypothetical protein